MSATTVPEETERLPLKMPKVTRNSGSATAMKEIDNKETESCRQAKCFPDCPERKGTSSAVLEFWTRDSLFSGISLYRDDYHRKLTSSSSWSPLCVIQTNWTRPLRTFSRLQLTRSGVNIYKLVRFCWEIKEHSLIREMTGSQWSRAVILEGGVWMWGDHWLFGRRDFIGGLWEGR